MIGDQDRFMEVRNRLKDGLAVEITNGRLQKRTEKINISNEHAYQTTYLTHSWSTLQTTA